MYNRYIRNDHGTYTRIPEEDGPPVPPSGGEPIHREESSHSGEPFQGAEPSHNGPPSHGREPSRNGEPSKKEGPPHGPPRRHGGFRRLLDEACMDRIDDGDLLLLGLLFFLAREGADEELLTALGLLLIL